MLVVLPSLLAVGLANARAQEPGRAETAAAVPPAMEAYLFAYFTGNAKESEQIRFAISRDGFRFRALHGNQPVVPASAISRSGGVRDPHLLRGADGRTFYMVATDMVSGNGWDSNRGIVLMKSTNLVDWTSSTVHFPERFAGQEELRRVWAPQTIHDPESGRYLIYFSTKYGTQPDRIHYAWVNREFTDLESEPQPLFDSPHGGACIDGDIVHHGGRFHLFFKTEDSGAGIRRAVSERLTGGYVLQEGDVQQTRDPVEGAGVFRLIDSEDYIVMYDVYTRGRYQFTRTRDFVQYEVVDDLVAMDFHPRHGSVIQISTEEAGRLETEWGTATGILRNARAPGIRSQRTRISPEGRMVDLVAEPDLDLAQVSLSFPGVPADRIAPQGAQDFQRGPVPFRIRAGAGDAEEWQVRIARHRNPVLPGYFADPDILYSEKTGKYYLYPTSDGYLNWSGTTFRVFSSENLTDWTDEGVILDLPRDVPWGPRNAWAPAIEEIRVGDDFRYFLYFTAAGRIGVAVSDSPTGPFRDSGQPLIDWKPAGVTGGQEIDPDVVRDPASGKHYLYWGNGYLAVAELKPDLLGLDRETVRVLTPDSTYREGTAVFCRNGTWYFLWSEDDTRSENYRVRYGTASSPTGPIEVPADNLILEKSPADGILATGHNSVLQIPGRDEWYIVYHRFSYPDGVLLGQAAGYHREVGIDRLQFERDGKIRKAVPTHSGIEPVASSGTAPAAR